MTRNPFLTTTFPDFSPPWHHQDPRQRPGLSDPLRTAGSAVVQPVEHHHDAPGTRGRDRGFNGNL